jgi:hypothetical protein
VLAGAAAGRLEAAAGCRIESSSVMQTRMIESLMQNGAIGLSIPGQQCGDPPGGIVGPVANQVVLIP